MDSSSITIRPAIIEDVPIIVDIYTSYVKNTVATYAEELPVLNDFINKFHDAQKTGLPWFVAVTNQTASPDIPILSSGSSESVSSSVASTTSVPSSSSYIVGYAYVSLFRPRSGWRFTVENTIYLREGYQRQGIGSRLVQQLLSQCEKNGYRQMLAVITVDEKTGDGLPSVQLHKRLGFVEAGMLKNVGFKFGRWLDCAFLQKEIGEGASTLPIG